MEEGNNPGDHLDLKRIERRLERTEDLLLRLMTITEGFQAQLHQLQGRLDRKGQVSLQSSDSSDEHHLPSVSSSESSSSSEEEYEDHREAGSDDEQTVRPAQVILTSSLQIIPEGFEALHRHFPEETERAISREVTVVIPDGFEAVPPVSPPQISENENLIDGFDPEDVYPVWGDADSDYQEDIEDSEENTGHKPQIKDALEILPDINGDGSISDSGSSSSQSSSPSPPPPPPALNSFTQRLMALIVAPIPDLKDGKLNSSGLNRPVLSSPGLQNLEMDILREIVDELKADWTSLELPKLNKQKEWDRVHRDNLFEQYREDLVHLEKRLQKIMEDIALANLGATREVLKKKSGSLEATVREISRVEFLLSLKDAERPENEVGTPLRNRRKVTTEGTENIGGGNEDDDLDGFIVPDDDEEERPLEEGAEAETARDVNMVSQHKEGRENHGEGAVESPIVVEETDNMEVDSDPDVVIYKVVEGRSCENAEIEDEMSQNCGLGQMKLLEEMALHGNTHFSERLLNAPTAESRKRVAVEQRRKGAKDTRKKARKIISDEDLNAETKAARAMQQQRKEQLERERIIAEGRAKLRSRADGDGVIINPAAESKDIVKINPYIASNLLQHQIDAVRFEWSLINSGTGCLLALCMGLGKTLCAIALLHTYLKKYPNQRGLVVVPANVLQNWDIEFEKWLPPDEEGLKQFLIGDEKGDKVREKRIEKLRSWKKNGGVVIISYHMLYELTEKQGTKYTSAQRQELQELLQDPGPDIVVADEAHVIRNDKSNLSRTLKSIKTRKRICLTGYPLQNNLNEYWCMFDFISPNLLGTMTEFSNRFTNPINSGRHRDSTFEESQISKRRSFQLHEELKLLMFRKSDLLLAEMLPPKLELVICCKMADVQHEYFCSANESLKNNELMDTKSAKLFSGFNALTLIGNHPKSFEYAMNREQDKGPDDDAAEVAVSSMSLKKKLEGYSGTSGKMKVLMAMLKKFKENNEKSVVFTRLLGSHGYLRDALNKEGFKVLFMSSRTSAKKRSKLVEQFNEVTNDVDVFLATTVAGGIGINLVSATRLILLDVNWNPSHEIQASRRIFRIGQQKPTFIYRLLNAGTIEEKVYKRGLTKGALARAVTDNENAKRRFTKEELMELFTFDEPQRSSNVEHEASADKLLSEIVKGAEGEYIMDIYKHDAQLEADESEELDPESKEQAKQELQDVFQKLRQSGKVQTS